MIKLQLWSQTFPCIPVHSYSLSSDRARHECCSRHSIIGGQMHSIEFWLHAMATMAHTIEAQDNRRVTIKMKNDFSLDRARMHRLGSVAPWSEQFFPLTVPQMTFAVPGNRNGIRLEYRLDPADGTSATLRSWKCTHFIQCLFICVFGSVCPSDGMANGG